ncbi:sensor histidine kinase [Methylobacterium soli]|uniref:histidine kinase n=1 Tax=Methylobacterium soli TaxID=553447 RepID=A0A6L3SUP0_9HYPH|nr:HAMP domain-containing sensor histidine kinase [Methylobacterium soli]KAB1074182.1 HAMP domain-containing histidine kinase [Methylobacterium soli]GJE46412.1 Cell-division control histidine kinase PdhS [Methylobacterium soli]
MTDGGAEAAILEDHEAVHAALQLWAHDSQLRNLLTDADAAYLVLGHAGTRLLHASAGARGLAAGLTPSDADRTLPGWLSSQIDRLGDFADRPRLARLRLDDRWIAAPTTCLLARRAIGDDALLLVVLMEKAPGLRARALRQGRAASLHDAGRNTVRPAETDVPPAPPLLQQPASAEAAVGDRFVWRTDHREIVAEISGKGADKVRTMLAGRSWKSLAAEGHLAGAAPLLTAIAERQTFRAIPVILVDGGGQHRFELDLSGSPRARAGQPFAGYAGFGLIRAVSVPSPPPALPRNAPDLISFGMATLDQQAADASEPAPRSDGEDAPVRASTLAPAALTLAALSLVALVPAARFGLTWTSGSRTIPANRRREREPVSHEGDAPAAVIEAADRARENAQAAIADAQPDLTLNEHAAFREIARALGARFEGDEPFLAQDAALATRGAGGAVMPFPVPRPIDARSAEPNRTEVAALLAGLPVALLVARGDSILYANRSLLDLAGFSDLADLEARGGMPVLFKGLPPRLHVGPAADMAGQTTGPVALMTRDGGSREIDLAAFAVEWDEMPAEGLLIRETRGDDPARQLAAERVAQTFREAHAAEARTALDALDDGVLTLDAADRIVTVNRAAAAFLDCAAREVVGSNFIGLFDPDSVIAVRAGLQAPGGPAREVTVRGATGAPRLSLRVVRSDGEGSRIAILRGLGTDLNTVDPVENERGSADVAGSWKADFLAKVSHEIRTPMNGILGFADVMLKEQFGPIGTDRYRDYLRDIHASGEQVLALVNDLVDLARIEAGRFELAFGPVSLNDLVSSCVTLLQPQAARNRIVVRTSFAADATMLLVDERSMRQAALNIIANAIKFTEAGGQVIVSTTIAERGEVALRVRDTGIGMTTDEIEAALEPFREVSVSGPRKGGGTGLGLPLTKALVEANYGRFRITSRKDGGTLVEMMFPAARQARSA